MTEDVEVVEGTATEPTGEVDSQDPETLAPETADPDSSVEGEKPEEGSERPQEPEIDLESEQEFELFGKTYKLAGKNLVEVLENAQRLEEKEKSLNRDYTQKTQALAETRKTFESAFGRMPEPDEIQALGKVWNAYFSNPQVAEIINSVIQGQPITNINGDAKEGQNDPQSSLVNSLKGEIHQLKSQLSQFISGSERKEMETAQAEGKRVFDSWLTAKKQAGVEVSEDQIDPILQWAGFLRQSNPNMDGSTALEQAYRHVNIDHLDKAAVGKVLKKADASKKKAAIKIAPKSPSRPENQSYADIFKDAM